MPAIHPASAGDSNKVPAAPKGEANSPEKQAKKTTRRFAERLKVELNTHQSSYEQSTQEWQFMEEPDVNQLQSLTSTRRTDDFSAPPSQQKRNYASLPTTLQTHVFSIPGFIATALVNVDGQPIAQVVVGDQDISQICDYFGSSMKGVLQALEVGALGHFEDTIITSLTHFILFRLVGGNRDIFQVLIVTRDSNPVECLEIMANIEPALEAAL